LPENTAILETEYELRVMCPKDTTWQVQEVGANGNKNNYYIGLKIYAPEEAYCFKEDLAEIIQDPTIYYFEDNEFAGIDKWNRKYSIVWLPVAEKVDDSWQYYGALSTQQKYIGWNYSVEWYNKDQKLIGTNAIRVNLSNEEC
jgi:hypothetical protein